MSMNQVILARRKALGLTQEQLAARLGVTAPAVNKWEKGASFPDVALMPPLARLLGVDLNELFGFHDELSAKEIERTLAEIDAAFKADGLERCLALAREQLRQYPNCVRLADRIAAYLAGALMLSDADDALRQACEAELERCYARLADCDDADVRDRAALMLASRRLRADDLDGAQAALNLLPDGAPADKRILQAELYLRQGRQDEAGRLMAKAVLSSVNATQSFLLKFVDVELADGDEAAAARIAEIAQAAAKLFELWPYNFPTAPLMVAVARRDVPACLKLLDELLESALHPWAFERTTLYRRLNQNRPKNRPTSILPTLLRAMEQDSACDFLRGEPRFSEMLDRYRRAAERG